ncbi:hypothetical protein SLT67_04610 [Paenibacillus illinoisensis]|uniref:hypothetical protein n=1 Tax=Paenibacillus illinoisensis TaxID=59845 RepID=UPI003CF5F6DA
MSKEFSEFLLQNKLKILKKVPSGNGIYTVTTDISKATHWRTTEEIGTGTDVTLGKVYPVLYHRQEQEEVILDDSGKLSLIYLVLKGEFLIVN